MTWEITLQSVDGWSAAGFVALIAALWVMVGLLKTSGRLATGDARKINHAAVLVGGAVWFWSDDPVRDRSTCHAAVLALFGLLLMVCRFRTVAPWRYAFVGYARESDRPHEGFHVWFSWLVSIAGLELADIAFGSLLLTRIAAMVLGIGDAVAEPIGVRYGRHRYFVRDVASGTPRQRSWEGSLAVGLATAAVVLLACRCLSLSALSPPAVLSLAILVGGLIAVVEAWTPHGLDNFTIPLCTACLLRWLLV